MKYFLFCVAADTSTDAIAGSVTAVVGALLIVVVVLLTVGLVIKWKRMKQIKLTQQHDLR